MRRSDRTIMYVGLGAVAFGAWYFLAGPGKKQASSSSVSLTTSPAPQSFNPNTDPCGAARRLIALGHPTEAQYWANLCAQRGGQV